MIIYGEKLSGRIIGKIKIDIKNLAKNGVTPKIAIVTVGPDTSWKTYVRRKIKLAEKLGINKELINLKRGGEGILTQIINRLNTDKKIHGIIVQRPLPDEIDTENVINLIAPVKDIDGFGQTSKYISPIWLAVEDVLKKAQTLDKPNYNFDHWLSQKAITVIGKGETGGVPIINMLKKNNINYNIIDTATLDKSKILQNSDIVISAVGKHNIVKREDLKAGAILVGIGIFRGQDNKLYGDYDEIEISKVASYYTPTPGGIGPLNLAYLFQNLLEAAINQSKNT